MLQLFLTKTGTMGCAALQQSRRSCIRVLKINTKSTFFSKGLCSSDFFSSEIFRYAAVTYLSSIFQVAIGPRLLTGTFGLSCQRSQPHIVNCKTIMFSFCFHFWSSSFHWDHHPFFTVTFYYHFVFVLVIFFHWDHHHFFIVTF